MARKTTIQTEIDVYRLAAPFLEAKIGGEVYTSSTRPRDSRGEDAVVCEPWCSSDQFQRGNIKILVFAQDIDNGAGHPVPDKGRLLEIAAWEDELLSTLNAGTDEYIFSIFDATRTGQYPGATEHFVCFHFQFDTETF